MHIRDDDSGRRYQKRKKIYKFLFGAIIYGTCMFAMGTCFGKFVFGRYDTEKVLLPEVEKTSAPTILEVTNVPVMYEDWKLVLINKFNPVTEGFVPELAMVENNYYFDARAAKYLKEMLADGRKAGLDFCICSAYRTIEKQTELFNNQVAWHLNDGMSYEEACELAATAVAYPGTSEHHLGLAVDIVARDYQLLDEHQAETAEAIWLKENCWKYGFILRYPLDKTEITGIIFEPWHYRYVGVEAAKEIMEKGICLEEYLQE